MSFDPTDEQRRCWRDLSREYAQDITRPRAEALDHECSRNDIVSEMASQGLMSLTSPEEGGGSGDGLVANNVALEGECRPFIQRTADVASQTRGGEGFMERRAVARFWRRVEIGEGTCGINRRTVARSLLKQGEAKRKMAAR